MGTPEPWFPKHKLAGQEWGSLLAAQQLTWHIVRVTPWSPGWAHTARRGCSPGRRQTNGQGSSRLSRRAAPLEPFPRDRDVLSQVRILWEMLSGQGLQQPALNEPSCPEKVLMPLQQGRSRCDSRCLPQVHYLGVRMGAVRGEVVSSLALAWAMGEFGGRLQHVCATPAAMRGWPAQAALWVA